MTYRVEAFVNVKDLGNNPLVVVNILIEDMHKLKVSTFEYIVMAMIIEINNQVGKPCKIDELVIYYFPPSGTPMSVVRSLPMVIDQRRLDIAKDFDLNSLLKY